MSKSVPPGVTQVDLDQVMALLDQSLGEVTQAVAKAQTQLRKARDLSAAISEQTGRIRTASDAFRLNFGQRMQEEVARASQRPAAG